MSEKINRGEFWVVEPNPEKGTLKVFFEGRFDIAADVLFGNAIARLLGEEGIDSAIYVHKDENHLLKGYRPDEETRTE